MTLVWILPVLSAVLLGVGVYLLRYTCVCRKVDDMWDPAMLDKHGFGMVKDAIAAGRAWMERQPVEELTCMSYDGLCLRGRFLPCENARGVILLFHGWRSSWKLDFTSVLPYYHSLGYALLLCDQRAQGESEGRYMTYGVRERHDVVSWVTCMTQLYGRDCPLFLDGLSMGATTVLMASAEDFDANVRGVIADCGFTSPYAIMDNFLSGRPGWMRRLALAYLDLFTRCFAGFSLRGYSTVQAVSRTALPVLLVHGTADSFVPPRMSQETYDACRGEKELLLIEGAGHGLSYPTDPARVRAAVGAFLERNRG